MTLKLYKIYTIIIIVICFASCRQLLDVDLPENQISSQTVFSDVQTADAALAGLYAGLWENSPLAGDSSGRYMGVYTDDLTNYALNGNSGILELSQNVQIASNPLVLSYWSSAYKLIYYANSIIVGVEKSSTIGDRDKRRLIGEALLIRSLLLYYLQQTYGDIPYPTTIDYQINQSLSKVNSLEVLNLLVNDLNKIIPMLEDPYRNTERIFVNRKTAELLLAKIYALQEKWNDAETLLKGIVQSNLYAFQPDITKVFLKSGSHILWQLKPKNSGDATKEVLTYFFTNGVPTNLTLSNDLVSSFSSNDLRKQYWMAEVVVNNNSWFRANKYKNLNANTTEDSIIFRLEEVYLLLAEVLTKQNKISEALPFVNKTRNRAGLLSIELPITKEMLLSEILLERRKEFFSEMGHRFFDLKRFNKLQILQSVKPNWKSFHQVWPIPEKEIQLNDNLNPQNNGY